ncbi:poly-gamma-glutamate synthesis protein (capsule biosynthesis protein) [Natronincola peptidivorans]|uniref:Poly-gamma-glutamate synthesis protein (Capsule biosynthesis protein) n=1 Tax=Natronincola peptidivorans TaxID=426128 RepID=A0A1I0GAZ8_9FIRM|nr:CapA family protein [Natronincola peptidivorans]SET68055.1 poly-gamma-glutamate synthesis protein (capsule biosynthesis protein) [Natronincola peptidivorans]
MALKKKRLLLLALLLITMLFTSCSSEEHTYIPTPVESEDFIEYTEEEITPPVEIVISAVGDIMVHGPQLRAQHNASTGDYDFTNNFQFIEAYLKAGDLTIGNLETTFGGEEKGYSSFPKFNTPDALADALKKAGFDVIVTANNHTIDTGSSGMLRTIDVLQNRDLMVVGTRRSEDINNFIMKDIKGIKIGLTAYTYESPPYGDFKTLNGLIVPKEVESLINTFSYDSLDEDLLKMKQEVKEMKAMGAEIIIFYLHWGAEYHRQPNHYQRYIAEKLAEYGVDIILGSHPHVVQPVEFIETTEGKTLVVYSMGNFISNQRYEILNNRFTEDGIIINIKIKKDFQEDLVTIEKVSYVPTWVHRYIAQGKTFYEIIPVADALEDKSFYNLNNQQAIWRVENSMKNTIEIIESENVSTMIDKLLVGTE